MKTNYFFFNFEKLNWFKSLLVTLTILLLISYYKTYEMLDPLGGRLVFTGGDDIPRGLILILAGILFIGGWFFYHSLYWREEEKDIHGFWVAIIVAATCITASSEIISTEIAIYFLTPA